MSMPGHEPCTTEIDRKLFEECPPIVACHLVLPASIDTVHSSFPENDNIFNPHPAKPFSRGSIYGTLIGQIVSADTPRGGKFPSIMREYIFTAGKQLASGYSCQVLSKLIKHVALLGFIGAVTGEKPR